MTNTKTSARNPNPKPIEQRKPVPRVALCDTCGDMLRGARDLRSVKLGYCESCDQCQRLNGLQFVQLYGF